jgi:hypothetical protein
MFAFDKIDFQRITIALVGALVLSTACVGAAVAPAEAAETSLVAPYVEGSQQLVITHA